MNDYSIALFLHIVGTLGFFLALGLEWTGLSQIRSAMTLEQVRSWMGILKNVHLLDADGLGRCGVDHRNAGITCPVDRARPGGHCSADGGHWAGSGLGEGSAVKLLPQPGEPPTPLDLRPEPSGHRTGHRLSQDRQAGFRWVVAHHRHRDRSRPGLNPVYAPT